MDINRINTNSPTGQIDFDKSVEQKVNRVEPINKGDGEGKTETKVKREDLDSSVKIANKVLFKNNTHLKFQIHDKTKEVMVKIINDESGEVVKEIPPEKMLDMVAKLWEIAGILIDERR